MKVRERKNKASLSLLSSYSDQMGRLVDRRMKTAALENAKHEAEQRALQAHRAMVDAKESADALRREIEQRMQVQSRLAYLAHHDPLTGLANRALLGERMQKEMERALRNGSQMALLCLDLDHFKDVNDTLGHAAGDTLLREVAHRLEACIRQGCVVARMGGDEFSILLTDLAEPTEARALAQRIISALSMPVMIGDQRVFIGVSIGITIFPHDGTQGDVLLRNADLALYRAKNDGRNGYYFFDADLNAEVSRRISLEQALHEALQHKQLSVAYQPQVDVATNRLTGVEALLRWKHPEYGQISPDEFVPAAERSGMIVNLGGWVLAESCRQIVAWDQQGMPPMRVAVNVATAQFKSADVPRLVANILQQTGVAPQRLELEITESGVMQDIRNAVDILRSLHQIGVSIAIDDFGTGYSSLAYLRRLPVDKIKVDRSFVTDITHNEDAATVAKTIVALGHSLRLKVVAEGVETEAHARYVRHMRCDVGQGYFYGQPTNADDLARLILRRNAAARSVAAQSEAAAAEVAAPVAVPTPKTVIAAPSGAPLAAKRPVATAPAAAATPRSTAPT